MLHRILLDTDNVATKFDTEEEHGPAKNSQQLMAEMCGATLDGDVVRMAQLSEQITTTLAREYDEMIERMLRRRVVREILVAAA